MTAAASIFTSEILRAADWLSATTFQKLHPSDDKMAFEAAV